MTYVNMGWYDQAIVDYSQVFKLNPDSTTQAQTWEALANAYFLSKNYEVARENYTRAISIWRQIGSRVDEARSLYEVGLTYAATIDNNMAQQYFGKSLLIAREVGDKKLEALIMGQITPTPTLTPTSTPTPTYTPSPTRTPTFTTTPTPSKTSTPTPTSTTTVTPSRTSTLTPTPTPCWGTRVYSTSEGPGGIVAIPLPSPHAISQICIKMLERTAVGAERYGFSLLEVEAYGPDTVANLLKDGTAIASSTEGGYHYASLAIDGAIDQEHRWSSAFSEPQWLEVTPPQAQRDKRVERIVLYWEASYAVKYEVYVRP